MDYIKPVTSIFYEDAIDEIITSIKTAFPQVTTYKTNKAISEYSSTNYIVFYPTSEVINPPRASSIIYDGYAAEVVTYRTVTVNARIYYETLKQVETMLNAILVAGYITCKIKNSNVVWVTQDEDPNINNQGELAILSFDLELPVLKSIERIATIESFNFTFQYGIDGYADQTIYNPNREIPPKFNI